MLQMNCNTICCVVGCSNTYKNTVGLRLFRIPGKQYENERREQWIMAIRRQRPDGTHWRPSKNTRICSDHFIEGKPSNISSHPDYIPSIFPVQYQKRSLDESSLDRHKRITIRKNFYEDASQATNLPKEKYTSMECTSSQDEISRISQENEICLNSMEVSSTNCTSTTNEVQSDTNGTLDTTSAEPVTEISLSNEKPSNDLSEHAKESDDTVKKSQEISEQSIENDDEGSKKLLENSKHLPSPVCESNVVPMDVDIESNHVTHEVETETVSSALGDTTQDVPSEFATNSLLEVESESTSNNNLPISNSSSNAVNAVSESEEGNQINNTCVNNPSTLEAEEQPSIDMTVTTTAINEESNKVTHTQEVPINQDKEILSVIQPSEINANSILNNVEPTADNRVSRTTEPEKNSTSTGSLVVRLFDKELPTVDEFTSNENYSSNEHVITPWDEEEEEDISIVPGSEISLCRNDQDGSTSPSSKELEAMGGTRLLTRSLRRMCVQCQVVQNCRYMGVPGDPTKAVCSYKCYKAYTSSISYDRPCSTCNAETYKKTDFFVWELMIFCDDECLKKKQLSLGCVCVHCKRSVDSVNLGKFCVHFGNGIKLFCGSTCFEEFKKGVKVCTLCHKDLLSSNEGFLAPAGGKEYRNFCTKQCFIKYKRLLSKNDPEKQDTEVENCSVCKENKPVNIEVQIGPNLHKLCSKPCFAAFKFVNHFDEGRCDVCSKYYDKVQENHCIYTESVKLQFCTKSCLNVFCLSTRKSEFCLICKAKKYNFDMIKKVTDGTIMYVCSLHCLKLAKPLKGPVISYKCDYCHKSSMTTIQVTSPDGTVSKLCSNACSSALREETRKQSENSTPILTKRVTRTSAAKELSAAEHNNVGSQHQHSVDENHTDAEVQADNISAKPRIYQHITTRPRSMVPMENKSTMCRSLVHNKGVMCRPVSCHQSTQTEKTITQDCLIPIPVPIFVPVPLAMYSTPYPSPTPFPLPIPVPVFVPTTRNSAKGILKEIKKIQEKTPSDPFEAELLMMAEMVAEDKKNDATDSDSDDDVGAGGAHDSSGGGGDPETGVETFSPVHSEPVDTVSNSFGDDVLQMALKMASELEEPAVDMESVLPNNTITPAQPPIPPTKNLYADSVVQPLGTVVGNTRGTPGRKRGSRGGRGGGTPNKRGRRVSSAMPESISHHSLTPTDHMGNPHAATHRIEIEKPDANMCLKYTFGVNAWRHWVIQKNIELEKAALTNRKIRPFKPDLLQLTSDELNFSLCLFVKEVKKPTNQEYAPDTIYYLCLGIQQYLFENGRIDNIFTDPYYEKFTDCLDDVARKFTNLYNDSQYIVTRVEEEHLWESKQLGAHSPHVLLSTLMFFNTKHFNLVSVEEHMQLSFSHIMKHWKRNPNSPGTTKIPGSRNVLLRFYPPQAALDTNSRKKKVYEQQENEDNPLRCPVKLYEFYLSKCPESVKTRNDVFYLMPERSCVPDSPVWYSTMAMGKEPLTKMLNRIKMVKEINIALLSP